MSASFEEKSVWIQLLSLFLVMGGYFVVAARMWDAGVTPIAAYVPLFAGAVVLLVVVQVAGHIVAAITSRQTGADERDRLIGWRAESNAAWILGVGVLLAIGGLAMSIDNLWVAHLLLAAMLLSELTKYALQLAYYRLGV